MIDLTKPIRMKKKGGPAHVVTTGELVYRIQTPYGIGEYTESRVGDFFENIPEPRRAKALLLAETVSGDLFVANHENHEDCSCRHLGTAWVTEGEWAEPEDKP